MSSSSSSNKKKQLDEQNLKILRELAALLPNKQCFDCHQRGPTYVNMTIGSFVCTSCSGLLRGLNPPHRVKSISMAVFTADEIELLKSRGNEYCRRVWVGRYDRGGRGPLDDISAKDETQMKDHLALKYEKKRWYVNPSEAFANSPPPVQQIPSSSQSTQPPAQRIQSGGSPAVAGIPPHPAHSRPSVQQPISNQDLLSRNPVAVSSSSVDVLFDPFGTGAFGSSTSSPSGSVHPAAAPFSNGLFQSAQPTPNTTDASIVPKSATVPGYLASTSQLQPITVQQQQQQQQQQQKQQPVSAGDKYSALAELDDLFHSMSPVDASMGAEKRQPSATPAGGGGVPTLSTAPSHFYPYQARPPAAAPMNPFTGNNGTATAAHTFGGLNPTVTSSYGYFPQSNPVNAPGQTVQGYRPQQQQFPAAMPPAVNPFATPGMHPAPTTTTPSWNPFL